MDMAKIVILFAISWALGTLSFIAAHIADRLDNPAPITVNLLPDPLHFAAIPEDQLTFKREGKK